MSSELSGAMAKTAQDLKSVKGQVYDSSMKTINALDQVKELLRHPDNIKAALQWVELAKEEMYFLKGYSK